MNSLNMLNDPSMVSFFRGLQQEGTPMLLPSLRRDSGTFDVLCGPLAQFYRTSVPVQWRKVFEDLAPGARLVDLPPYPFADTRFWVPYKRSPSTGADARPRRQELGVAPSPSTTTVPAVEIPLDSLADLIQGHQVFGFPLCPASVYTDLVLAEARRVLRGRRRRCGDVAGPHAAARGRPHRPRPRGRGCLHRGRSRRPRGRGERPPRCRRPDLPEVVPPNPVPADSAGSAEG